LAEFELARITAREIALAVGSSQQDKPQQQDVCDDHGDDRLQHESGWA